MRHIVAWIIVAFIAITPLEAKGILRGSRQSLARQNSIADRQGLPRMTEKNIEWYKKNKHLVKVPDGRGVRINTAQLPKEYRWCLPRTRHFLEDAGKAYSHAFKAELLINSAVRTNEHQRRLIRVNANAARGNTPSTRSLHLTGAAIDITRIGMTNQQQNWMRKYLNGLRRNGNIDYAEEINRKVFHIIVIRWSTT